MNLARLHKILITLLACLTFWAGASSLAHAAEHAQDPHDHECVMCMHHGPQEQVADILPVIPAISTPVIETFTPDYIAYISAQIRPAQSRAPPPRGPPA